MNQNRNKQCFDGCRSEAVACSGMVCYNYNAKLQLVVGVKRKIYRHAAVSLY